MASTAGGSSTQVDPTIEFSWDDPDQTSKEKGREFFLTPALMERRKLRPGQRSFTFASNNDPTYLDRAEVLQLFRLKPGTSENDIKREAQGFKKTPAVQLLSRRIQCNWVYLRHLFENRKLPQWLMDKMWHMVEAVDDALESAQPDNQWTVWPFPMLLNWTTNEWKSTDGKGTIITPGAVNKQGRRIFPITQISQKSTNQFHILKSEDEEGVVVDISSKDRQDPQGHPENNELKLLTMALELYHVAFQEHKRTVTGRRKNNVAKKENRKLIKHLKKRMAAGHLVDLHKQCLTCTAFRSPLLLYCRGCKKACHMRCIGTLPPRRTWEDVFAFACRSCALRDDLGGDPILDTQLTEERLAEFSVEDLKAEVQEQAALLDRQAPAMNLSKSGYRDWLRQIDNLVVEKVGVERTAPDVPDPWEDTSSSGDEEDAGPPPPKRGRIAKPKMTRQSSA